MSAGSHPPSFKAYGSKGFCAGCGRKITPTEPVWFRGGWTPDTPLTGNGLTFKTREFKQFDEIFHNDWVGGDPETPVFEANAGEDLRLRVVYPAGHSQGHVFELHGHPWLENPYVASSSQIGFNPTSEWIGSRGLCPADHFDGLVVDGAGGTFRIGGDYFYRSYPGARLDAGMWGVLRVNP